MNRREFTAALAVGGAALLAGCSGDSDKTASENGDTTDTPAAEPTPEAPTPTATPQPATDGTPTESEGAQTDTPTPGPGDPAAVVRAFVRSFGTGEPAQINSFVHPDSPADRITQEDADELAAVSVAIDAVTVTERTEQQAVVEVTFSEESAPQIRRIERLELRVRDGAWNVYRIERRQQAPQPPNAAFDVESEAESVRVTHSAGDSIPAAELFVRGEGLAEMGSWRLLGGETDDGTVTAGLGVSVPAADTTVTVRIVWESQASDSSATLVTATVEVESGNEDVPEEVTEYLEGANAHDGTLADWTDRDEATVVVGGGDDYAFDPPAVRVTPGTTLVWEWSGNGGSHNVVHEDGAFESELVAQAGHTFEHRFVEPGTYLYYCFPHRRSGMRGAVVVEETSGNGQTSL